MRLYVIARYRAAGVEYHPGLELDLSDAEARRLLADAPSCFTDRAPRATPEVLPTSEETEPEDTAIEEPEDPPPSEETEPEDKAIGGPPSDKMMRAPVRGKANP